jgi:hypothetical protein
LQFLLLLAIIELTFPSSHHPAQAFTLLQALFQLNSTFKNILVICGNL